jgi:hypothetical protein
MNQQNKDILANIFGIFIEPSHHIANSNPVKSLNVGGNYITD